MVERGQRKDKQIREALMLAAKRIDPRDPESRTYLAVAAEKVVIAAADGDLASFQEMANRLDGKAVQQLDVTTTHERPASEWTESELDAAIARLAAGKAEKATSAEKPGRVH